jgi:phytoene desaturase
VVVVGAGLSGLSAALRLAGAGRQVTVVERDDEPGGRAGVLRRDGYVFDTGPSVLTMPGLVDDAFAAVGETTADWVDLVPVEPGYRARFHDGTELSLFHDQPRMEQHVREVLGGEAAASYRGYVDHVTRLYELQARHFIDRNMDGPWSVMVPDLARLAAMGGFRRLGPTAARHLPDERLRRAFTFQSLYAGVAPQDALALYGVISYMDVVAGVWFARGGMHALVRGLAGAAEKAGVDFRYGTTVSRVERRGRRALALRTASGERIEGDAFVLTADLPVARRDLLDAPMRRVVRPTYSPSCWLMLAGSREAYADPDGSAGPLHTIDFGQAWEGTFDELTGGRLMSDPSFLVTAPTRLDPTLAPEGGHTYSVLFPTPHLDGEVDWTREAAAYRDHVLATLDTRGWSGFGEAIEVDDVTTPLEWEARGMEKGTPFAMAHTFRQTGPFRPRNLWGENVALAGSGTTPGVGVPMVLVSGRLAAERITGPDRSYRSRVWP